uniref:Uncharacterized protein n=1 Tax=Kalanchoe fedtschenkoi TaxID=63787 RepID=A0A7N0TZ70_KALFE
MVLEDCKTCMAYWLKNGRDMAGYRCLVRDKHITEAHAPPIRRRTNQFGGPAAESDGCTYYSGLARVGTGRAGFNLCSAEESPSTSTSSSELDHQVRSARGPLKCVTLAEDEGEGSREKSEAASHIFPQVVAISAGSESSAGADDAYISADDREEKEEEKGQDADDDEMEHFTDMIPVDTSWYFPLYNAAMSGDWENGYSNVTRKL